MLLLFSIRVAEWPPVWKKLFTRFTVRDFRERLSFSVFVLLSLLDLRVVCGT